MKSRAIIGICGMVFVSSALADEDSANEEGKPPRLERSERKPPKGHDPHRRPPHGPPADMFKRMDEDGDGNITKEEFFTGPRLDRLPAEKREKIFERLDQNGDGVLSREEIRKIRKEGEDRRKRELRSLDTDNSGGLSFDEISKGEFFGRLPEEKRRQIFDRMDTDGNGEINAEDKPQGPPQRKNRREEAPRKRTED